MYAYHIDRTNSNIFRPGDNLMISSVDTRYEETNSLLSEKFQNKLTKHGQRYFINSIDPTAPWDNFYETIFEYERRMKFSKLPSRFQSLFAVETLDDLEHWKSILNLSGNEHVWKIQADESNVFKADASWFKLDNYDQSVLRISYNASQYWLGKNRPKYDYEPELLIKGPVRLVEQIN